MNKMLVATFANETNAYKGLDALQELDTKGAITLYATAVLTKTTDGSIDVKKAVDKGPAGTALGMLTGSLLGILGGPIGVAYGATAGGMTGLLFDLGDAGVEANFVDEVSGALKPGVSAVLAEIDEDWITPVNSKIEELGGHIIRRPRIEVVDGQLAAESAAFKQELSEAQQELQTSKTTAKAAVQKQVEHVKAQSATLVKSIDSRLERISNESKAKVEALETQLKNSTQERKEKIEKRIEEIKADQKRRSTKLQEAKKLAQEALSVKY